MNEHFVYILFSEKMNRFYVGESAFPEERLKEHNAGKYAKSYSLIAKDWALFLTINCRDRSHALQIERKIKSMKSSKYIQNLKKYPELVEKLRNM